MPRGLLLLWVVFLCATWIVSLDLDSAAPAVRWMVFGSLIGLTLIWPAYRLSLGDQPLVAEQSTGSGANARRPSPRPAHLLRDWAVLMLVLQIAIWPLRLTAEWSITQTLWLIGALGAWGLLAGLIVAVGVRSAASGGRAWAMVLCCLMVLGEPLVKLAVNVGRPPSELIDWPFQVSPLGAVWRLAEPTRFWTPGPWPSVVISVAVAAVIGWAMLLAWDTRHRDVAR